MTIEFEVTREIMKMGAKAFYSHRHQSHLFPVLVVMAIMIFLLLYFVFDPNPILRVCGAIILSVALWTQIQAPFKVAKTVSNAMKSEADDRHVVFITSDESVSFSNGKNHGTSEWSAFVDFKVCKNGLLIYPQKEIFIWIPDTAEIEGGTWQDFTGLIASKITRKV